ncbi:Fur family transcriptional regulator [Actinomycetota bacterium]
MDLRARLAARGMRLTPQRARVLDAVERLVHATPDEIADAVARDGGEPLTPSTVYRSLDALAEIGVVDHTHLDHGAPSYHLADHVDHVHLVCRGCGKVQECDLALAGQFVESVRAATGFEAQVGHMAIHGLCSDCAAAGGAPPNEGPQS